MKKFGFGKKDKEGSSRTSSPAPSNPYLVSQGSDPYSQGPPAYSSSGPANDKFRDQKSAGNASDYGTGRYGAGAGSYGQSSGYSQSSRYGPAGGNDGPAQSAYGERIVAIKSRLTSIYRVGTKLPVHGLTLEGIS
jgi:hypothetical protein